MSAPGRRPKYEQLANEDSFNVESGEEFFISCCDCGLTHSFTLRKVRNAISVDIKRAERSTAMRRRHNEFSK